MNNHNTKKRVQERKDREYLFVSHNKGKLTGVPSISTSCRINKYCMERSKINGTICQKCFAQKLLSFELDADRAYRRNYERLQKVLPKRLLPITNCLYFRFESFGDISCINHGVNYLKIAKINKHTMFTAWTKNIELWNEAIDIFGGKPENFILIVSSPFINTQLDIDKDKHLYRYVDKVFTVYDKLYARQHHIKINCGDRDCLICTNCYRKNGVRYVNELLK